MNPEHLEVSTHSENVIRSFGFRLPWRKAVCKNGHTRSGDNLYTSPDGRQRHCRTCSREKNRAAYWRKVARMRKK